MQSRPPGARASSCVVLALAARDAHQLAAHLHHHGRRPSDRHAAPPGERRALHLRLVHVRGSMAIYFLIVRRWPAPPNRRTPIAPATRPRCRVRGVCAGLRRAGACPQSWQWLDTNRAYRQRATAYALPLQVAGGARRGRPVARRSSATRMASSRAPSVRGILGVQALPRVYLQQEQGKELAGYANRPPAKAACADSSVVTRRAWRLARNQCADLARRRLARVVRYRVDEHGYVDALRAQLRLRCGLAGRRSGVVGAGAAHAVRADCPAARERLARLRARCRELMRMQR